MKCEPFSETLSLIKARLDELTPDELRKLAEWIEVYALSKEQSAVHTVQDDTRDGE